LSQPQLIQPKTGCEPALFQPQLNQPKTGCEPTLFQPQLIQPKQVGSPHSTAIESTKKRVGTVVSTSNCLRLNQLASAAISNLQLNQPKIGWGPALQPTIQLQK